MPYDANAAIRNPRNARKAAGQCVTCCAPSHGWRNCAVCREQILDLQKRAAKESPGLPCRVTSYQHDVYTPSLRGKVLRVRAYDRRITVRLYGGKLVHTSEWWAVWGEKNAVAAE